MEETGAATWNGRGGEEAGARMVEKGRPSKEASPSRHFDDYTLSRLVNLPLA